MSKGQKRAADSLSVVLASDGATSAVLGKVGIDQTTPGSTNLVQLPPGKGSVATLTSTDTGALTANDVIGPTNASNSALTFANVCAIAGDHIITSVALEIDVTAVVSGMTSYRLYLYNVTPPSALNGNAAWDLPSGDRASFLGYVDLGAPVDLGSTLYVETSNVNKQITTASTSVFGYLVTNGGYTGANPTAYVITLHTVPA